MGGKTSSSTSTVQIPPEVLARYNAVNARAEEAAKNPFQPYGGQFVAGLTPEQQAGIQQTSSSSQAAQPYFGAATGLTMAGAQDVGALTPGQIGYYQNPYTEAVVAPTVQALQQQQGQQRAEQQAQAIKSGAAFGERANLARNDLMRQQALGTAQAVAPLYQQGFGQAAQIAAGQQGVVASDMARRLQAGQQLAGLGAGAQQAGIQGAQALLAAGTVGQQTQQADLTARYQEFLQKQGYPFQTAQFLANIAMGTGALSGSTTSTTQPAPFFSDERLKHDAKKIGETNDGLPIYSFKYNGDDRTQIGLMAQDVEKKKPEAVGLAPASDGRMYKTVDYDRATRAKKYAGGGLVGMDYDPSSMGGAVGPESLGEAFARGGYASGGPSILSSADHKALMAANVDPEAGPYAEHGIYKTPRNVIPGLGGSKINMGKAPPTPSLVTANPAGGNTAQQIGLGRQALAGIQTGKELVGAYDALKSGYTGAKNWLTGADEEKARGGLALGRHAYALDGGVDDDKTEDQGEGTGVVIPGMKGGIPLGAGAKMAQLATAKSPTGGGQQRGPGNDIMDAVSLGKGVFDLGSGAMKFFGMFADGGTVPRKGYAGDDGESGAVVDPGLIVSPAARKSIIAEGDVAEGGGDATALAPAKDVAPPREFKIAPQRKEDMEPHWQKFINRTYSGEGGFDKEGKPRYNIRQGGLETFDPETGHPGPGKPRGGESSAAGAGQFIHGTWQRITGGAPMTEAYQDAATKELAIQDYKARTGRDLDADLRERGLAPDILGALSPTWTSFRKDGSAPSPGLSFGRSGEGKYSGKEASQASIGDVVGEFLPKSVPTTANFWVPALSGLGSMLSSKSPYLLGAVGEGLVGGVSGYQAQKKEERETVKNIFDMVKNRFTKSEDNSGNTVFVDNLNGSVVRPDQVANTVSKILTNAGIDPEPYGISRTQTTDAAKAGVGARQITDAGTTSGAAAPAKQEQVAQASSPQKTSASTTPAPNVDKPTQNIYEMNPGQLREMVISGQIPGGPPDARARQANINERLARADRMAGSIDPDIAAKGIKLKEIVTTEQKLLDDKINQVLEYQSAQNTEFAKGRSARINTYKEAIDTRAPTYEPAIANLQRLAKLASEQPTGKGSEAAAALVSGMKRFGLGNFIPENWQNLAGGYDEIMKISTAQMLNQLMQDKIIRAPQSGLKYEQATVPSPSTDPDAFYALVGNKLGEVMHSKAKDEAYIAAPIGSLDPAKHELQWPHQKGNDLTTYKRMAFGQIPVNDRVLPEQIRSLQDSHRDPETGQTFTPRRTKPVSEVGPAARAAPPSGEAKTEAPAAPAVPAPLQNLEGLQYSASRNQYRDKAGNVYDASGKRVQ